MPAIRNANSAARYPGCAEDVDLELESSLESLQNIGKFRNKVMHLEPKFVCAAETRNS